MTTEREDWLLPLSGVHTWWWVGSRRMLGSRQQAHLGPQPRKHWHLHPLPVPAFWGPGQRPLTLASTGHTAATPSAAQPAALGPVPSASSPCQPLTGWRWSRWDPPSCPEQVAGGSGEPVCWTQRGAVKLCNWGGVGEVVPPQQGTQDGGTEGNAGCLSSWKRASCRP